MSDVSMLQGILDLYESCTPNSLGDIQVSRLRAVLKQRVPDFSPNELLRLVGIEECTSTVFIEFWSMMEKQLLLDSHFEDSDDLDCLRLLRDRILLSETRRSGSRNISHNSLVGILVEVRDKAVNKSTWQDAISSVSSSSSDTSHSTSTISAAIKEMVVDFIKSSEVRNVSRPVSDGVEFPPSRDFQGEFSDLKRQLADSEKTSSELRAEVELLRGKLAKLESQERELKKLRDHEISSKMEVDLLTSRLSQAEAKCTESDALLNRTTAKLTEAARVNDRLLLEKKQIETELAEVRVAAVREQEIFHEKNLHQSDQVLPTLEEWRRTLHQLRALTLAAESADGGVSSVETLLAQIQTLEVQKSDAESEITRLKLALDQPKQQVVPVIPESLPFPIPSSVPSTPISRPPMYSRKPSSLVEVYGTPSRVTPKLLGESFVDIASPQIKRGSAVPSGSSSVRLGGSAKSSARQSKKDEGCIQQ